MRTFSVSRSDARRHAPRGIAAAAVLALALSGCGGGESAGEEPSAPASSSSTASAPASTEPSTQASGEPSTGSSADAGSAEAKQAYLDVLRQAAEQEDVSVRTRAVSTAAGPQGQETSTTVTGVTVIEDGKVSARLDTEIPGSTQKSRILIVDGVFYVQSPALEDGRYVQIDLGEAAGQLGEQLQQQLDAIDPRAQAQAQIASVQSVEDLGEGTVNGVAITRYRVTQDFEAAARAQDNQILRQLLNEGIAPDQLTSDVSVDDEGRVRRIELELDVQGITVKTVADYLEYDVKASISAPPQSRIVQMPQG